MLLQCVMEELFELSTFAYLLIAIGWLYLLYSSSTYRDVHCHCRCPSAAKQRNAVSMRVVVVKASKDSDPFLWFSENVTLLVHNNSR